MVHFMYHISSRNNQTKTAISSPEPDYNYLLNSVTEENAKMTQIFSAFRNFCLLYVKFFVIYYSLLFIKRNNRIYLFTPLQTIR